MKKHFSVFLCILLMFSFIGCAEKEGTDTTDGVKIVDALGNTAYINKESKIAVCYGSFAQCLQLSGISPVAVTKDAIDEHKLEFNSDTKIIGTVKQINLEELLAVNPDYVIMSADLSAQLKLENSLKNAGLNYGYFRVDTFEDYKSFMSTLCAVSGREDLFQKNVSDTEKGINNILSKIPAESDKTVLLLRAFSSGVKAKRQDNLAGQILKELGLKNVADEFPSLMEDLSSEQIIHHNPDYIFILTMGSEQSAINFLKNNIENTSAFKNLKAVKTGNYVLLPKDLFHYKPNNRWDEAYEYLAKIIYPESF